MSDLFSKHPTKADLWKYEGRLDDVIILARGTNVHPTFLEETLQKDERVAAALVVGNGRPRLAVVIQLASSHSPSPHSTSSPSHSSSEIPSKSKGDIMDMLWSLVQECNKLSPSTAQIPKEAIVVAREEKPFTYSAKGGIQRKRVEELYGEEIEGVYALNLGD